VAKIPDLTCPPFLKTELEQQAFNLASSFAHFWKTRIDGTIPNKMMKKPIHASNKCSLLIQYYLCLLQNHYP
jgi:hypothetical protein